MKRNLDKPDPAKKIDVLEVEQLLQLDKKMSAFVYAMQSAPDDHCIFVYPEAAAGTFSRGPSESSKYSVDYNDCVGLVAVGTSDSGSEISLMTHDDPHKLFTDPGAESRLKKLLQNLKDKAQESTLSVSLFGGNVLAYDSVTNEIKELLGKTSAPDFKDKLRQFLEDRAETGLFEKIMRLANSGDENYLAPFAEKSRQLYMQTVAYLSKIVFDVLGIEPEFASGPNVMSGNTDAYFKTDERKLIIVRKKQDETEMGTEFVSSHVSELRKKLDKLI